MQADREHRTEQSKTLFQLQFFLKLKLYQPIIQTSSPEKNLSIGQSCKTLEYVP